MNKKNVLSVKNLNKIYNSSNSNSINALNNLNLDVKEGEIFGLLGPNGAGKTTFINILAGTVIKTSGEVIVWGFDLDKNPRQVRASIGIVPQEVNLDPFFSPKKILELQAGLYGIKKEDRNNRYNFKASIFRKTSKQLCTKFIRWYEKTTINGKSISTSTTNNFFR